MKALSFAALLTFLIAFYIHERMHRYSIVAAGNGKAFLVDQATGRVRILAGVASMPVEEVPLH